MSNQTRSSAFPATLKGEPAEVWAETTEAGIRLSARRRGMPASRSTLDELDDMVLLADDEGRYLDANVTFCAATGYSFDETLGLCVAQISAPEVAPQTGSTWRRFLRKGAMAGRYPLKLKNGSVRLFAYQAFTNVLPGAHISLLRPIDA